MDRAGNGDWAAHGGDRRGPGDEFILPSRSEVLERLRAAVERPGPALLTGDAGVGKTWLCRRLRTRTPADWRWGAVDLTPALGPVDFHRLVAHSMGLGLRADAGLAEARAAVADALAEAEADGRRWGVVVEEAHGAGLAVLEELRVLSNRVGEADGLAALILVGQTALTRRLGTRPLAALASRLTAWSHLRPLGVDEVGHWLGRQSAAGAWGPAAIEALHRDTGGNPRRVALQARTDSRPAPALDPSPVSAPPATAESGVATFTTTTTSPSRPAHWDIPPVAPVKPPLRMSEGMIEVGWEPLGGEADSPDNAIEPEPSTHEFDGAPTTPSALAPLDEIDDEDVEPEFAPETDVEPAELLDERIEDHYTALQAWNEWALTQGQAPRPPADPTTVETGGDADHGVGRDGVWADGQHAFAPYSQLFSRLRQARGS